MKMKKISFLHLMLIFFFLISIKCKVYSNWVLNKEVLFYDLSDFKIDDGDTFTNIPFFAPINGKYTLHLVVNSISYKISNLASCYVHLFGEFSISPNLMTSDLQSACETIYASRYSMNTAEFQEDYELYPLGGFEIIASQTSYRTLNYLSRYSYDLKVQNRLFKLSCVYQRHYKYGNIKVAFGVEIFIKPYIMQNNRLPCGDPIEGYRLTYHVSELWDDTDSAKQHLCSTVLQAKGLEHFSTYYLKPIGFFFDSYTFYLFKQAEGAGYITEKTLKYKNTGLEAFIYFLKDEAGTNSLNDLRPLIFGGDFRNTDNEIDWLVCYNAISESGKPVKCLTIFDVYGQSLSVGFNFTKAWYIKDMGGDSITSTYRLEQYQPYRKDDKWALIKFSMHDKAIYIKLFEYIEADAGLAPFIQTNSDLHS
eukprot:TRINITY_DN3326_c2_g2_i1.p1 TRINITY_DN3326_c2_g2~~TRINITY_DN3326_c2_g2_i1.p1  ORF type:complete len:421 (+),score=71.45 TRINITY_DN3326_c2_g2_i1:87-1349(+)